MRIDKIGFPVLLALFVMESASAVSATGQETESIHSFENSHNPTTVMQLVSVNQGGAVQLKEKEAWHQYCEAKNAVNAGVRSETYANAIQSITGAIAQGEERPETYLLASRIYRGKGGVSYAKGYFSKASAIYLDDVLRYPESIESNLAAAIILYAGDVRYWDTYNDSKQKAEVYADKVLELFKIEKIKKFKNRRDKSLQNKSRESFLEEAAALAYLVKENFAAAEKRFARAEKLYKNQNEAEEKYVNNRSGNHDHSFVNIVLNGDASVVKTEGRYLPYYLYKKYTKQGKWYWPVTKQTEANKEFLLNCLTGFYLE